MGVGPRKLLFHDGGVDGAIKHGGHVVHVVNVDHYGRLVLIQAVGRDQG